MAKLTKKEIVRRYAEKNPTMTARQMASDLDMTPAYVNTALWTLRKEGKAPPSKNPRSRQTTIASTINEWEGGQMKSSPSEDHWKLSNTIPKWEEKDPTNGFASAPVKNEGDKISYDISDTLAGAVLARKIELLEEKVHNQSIIIQYLEKRLDEEKAKGS